MLVGPAVLRPCSQPGTGSILASAPRAGQAEGSSARPAAPSQLSCSSSLACIHIHPEVQKVYGKFALGGWSRYNPLQGTAAIKRERNYSEECNKE